MSKPQLHKQVLSLVGNKYGLLTVTEFAGRKAPTGKQAATFWECLCECGVTVEVIGQNLKSGKSQSCGCRKKALTSVRSKLHGKTNSTEWMSWKSMWDRCTNPNDSAYGRYFDKVPPEEWREFQRFLADMGPKPSPRHTLDRVDNSKPYGPGNCRWATWGEQARNTSRNVWIEMYGRRQVIADWATELGTSPHGVRKAHQEYLNTEIK